mgnify:FL=1
MNNTQSNFDLEERTFQFAKRVTHYVRKLSKTISNIQNKLLGHHHLSVQIIERQMNHLVKKILI